jgi:AcrR family transcriptional regulator
METIPTQARRIGRPLSFDRAETLEKAMLTFWRHGYETTSISDLTTAMGITAPSIYVAFKDKKHLFLEAMHLYAGSPYDIDEALGDAPTSREAVHKMLTAAVVAFTGEHTPRGCLLASATASGSEDAADVQAAVAEVRQQIQNRVEKRISRDVAEQVLRPDTNSRALAGMTITMIQGMSVLARDGASRQALLDIVKVLMSGWPSK